MIKLTYLQGNTDILTVSLPEKVDPMVGREGATNDITLHDPKVSRIHARIVRRGNEVVIQDLHSRFGTFVNGVQVETTHVLLDGDRLRFGDIEMRITIAPWTYEEAQERTIDLQFCPNSECRRILNPDFQFCPHCGQSK